MDKNIQMLVEIWITFSTINYLNFPFCKIVVFSQILYDRFCGFFNKKEPVDVIINPPSHKMTIKCSLLFWHKTQTPPILLVDIITSCVISISYHGNFDYHYSILRNEPVYPHCRQLRAPWVKWYRRSCKNMSEWNWMYQYDFWCAVPPLPSSS